MLSYQDYLAIGLRIIDLRGFTWNHGWGISEIMYWDNRSIVLTWKTKRQATIERNLSAMRWRHERPNWNCRCREVVIDG